jgi:hypothetical protein
VNKLTVYGLPLNPMPALEQLKGASFCVSYGTRDKLGKQLDQAIALVGSVESSILLVDNGAYSAFKSGIDTMTDEAYLEGFAAWANDITARCPQAFVVLPDVIDGSAEDNWQLACETLMMLNAGDRTMPIWHMHEPISYLIHLCESFNYIGFGSSGEYFELGPKWHARIKEAFAAINKWEAECEGAYVRPRIHMMRAQKFAHLYPFDSSDSTNVAMNHNRQFRKSGETIAQLAARVDARIQASAGAPAAHQIAQPLTDYWPELSDENRRAWFEQEPELDVIVEGAKGGAHFPGDNADGLDIPEFLRRAA